VGSVIVSISGDIDADGKDIFDDGVNLAARLEALAATPAHAGTGHGCQSADKRVRSLRVRAHATPCGPDGLSGGAYQGGSVVQIFASR
jgi:class 3 adenylate cyclase